MGVCRSPRTRGRWRPRLLRHAGRRALLRLQVLLGDAQPDALLAWQFGSRARLFYLDGHTVHASTAHGRVGSSAAKRRGLRERGSWCMQVARGPGRLRGSPARGTR
ncbi:hypothetical protein QJS66_14030 [Kocuria rhizophila]|nr:hypothetical protein QJS66_14030 [Kocuria rhizophila]